MLRLSGRRALPLCWAALGLPGCLPPPVGMIIPLKQVPTLVLEQGLVLPGFSEHTVRVGKSRRRFAVFAPPLQGAAKEHILVLYLHGAMRSKMRRRPVTLAQQYHVVECLIEPALRRFYPIILMPISLEGEGGRWWEDGEAAYTLALLDAAARQWPINKHKVLVTGYSNGGIGAWVYARLYPERFSAAMPIAFDHAVMGETPLPVFAVHGTKDEFFHFHEVKEQSDALRRAGQNLHLESLYRGSHFRPCDYTEQLKAGSRWLEEEVWPKTR